MNGEGNGLVNDLGNMQGNGKENGKRKRIMEMEKRFDNVMKTQELFFFKLFK